MRQEEIVQEIEQSFTQEGCQEDNEVNLSITPGIEEHVVKELEVMKPCGVIEEVEQLLTQEEFTLTPIQPSQPLKSQKAPQKNLLFTPLHPIEPSPIFHPCSLTLFYVSLEMMPCDLLPQKLPYCEHDPFLERLANPLSMKQACNGSSGV